MDNKFTVKLRCLTLTSLLVLYVLYNSYPPLGFALGQSQSPNTTNSTAKSKEVKLLKVPNFTDSDLNFDDECAGNPFQIPGQAFRARLTTDGITFDSNIEKKFPNFSELFPKQYGNSSELKDIDYYISNKLLDFSTSRTVEILVADSLTPIEIWYGENSEEGQVSVIHANIVVAHIRAILESAGFKLNMDLLPAIVYERDKLKIMIRITDIPSIDTSKDSPITSSDIKSLTSEKLDFLKYYVSNPISEIPFTRLGVIPPSSFRSSPRLASDLKIPSIIDIDKFINNRPPIIPQNTVPYYRNTFPTNPEIKFDSKPFFPVTRFPQIKDANTSLLDFSEFQKSIIPELSIRFGGPVLTSPRKIPILPLGQEKNVFSGIGKIPDSTPSPNPLILNMSFAILPCAVFANYINYRKYKETKGVNYTFTMYLDALAKENKYITETEKLSFEKRLLQTYPKDGDFNEFLGNTLSYADNRNRLSIDFDYKTSYNTGKVIGVAAGGNYGLGFSMAPGSNQNVISVGARTWNWDQPYDKIYDKPTVSQVYWSNAADVTSVGEWFTLSSVQIHKFCNQGGTCITKDIIPGKDDAPDIYKSFGYRGTSFAAPSVSTFLAMRIGDNSCFNNAEPFGFKPLSKATDQTNAKDQKFEFRGDWIYQSCDPFKSLIPPLKPSP